MGFVLLAFGVGCAWHGLQVIWVAPRARLFQSAQEKARLQAVAADSAQAFQVFWLDQYAWIGIVLTVIGLVSGGSGLLLL